MGSRLYGLEVWRMIKNLKEMRMSYPEMARELSVSRVDRMLKKTRIQEKKKSHWGQSLIHTWKRSVYS